MVIKLRYYILNIIPNDGWNTNKFPRKINLIFHFFDIFFENIPCLRIYHESQIAMINASFGHFQKFSHDAFMFPSDHIFDYRIDLVLGFLLFIYSFRRRHTNRSIKCLFASRNDLLSCRRNNPWWGTYGALLWNWWYSKTDREFHKKF